MNAIEIFEAELKTMTDDQILTIIENFITNTKCDGVDENSKNLQIAYNELDKRMSNFDEYDENIFKNQGEENMYSELDGELSP